MACDRFIKTIYGEDPNDPERGPSLGELKDADELVSDEEMRELSSGVDFSPDDFLGPAPGDQWRFTPQFVKDWCDDNLNGREYGLEHGGGTGIDGMNLSRSLVKDMCSRFVKGKLNPEEVRLARRNNERCKEN